MSGTAHPCHVCSVIERERERESQCSECKQTGLAARDSLPVAALGDVAVGALRVLAGSLPLMQPGSCKL